MLHKDYFTLVLLINFSTFTNNKKRISQAQTYSPIKKTATDGGVEIIWVYLRLEM